MCDERRPLEELACHLYETMERLDPREDECGWEKLSDRQRRFYELSVEALLEDSELLLSALPLANDNPVLGSAEHDELIAELRNCLESAFQRLEAAGADLHPVIDEPLCRMAELLGIGIGSFMLPPTPALTAPEREPKEHELSGLKELREQFLSMLDTQHEIGIAVHPAILDRVWRMAEILGVDTDRIPTERKLWLGLGHDRHGP